MNARAEAPAKLVIFFDNELDCGLGEVIESWYSVGGWRLRVSWFPAAGFGPRLESVCGADQVEFVPSEGGPFLVSWELGNYDVHPTFASALQQMRELQARGMSPTIVGDSVEYDADEEGMFRCSDGLEELQRQAIALASA